MATKKESIFIDEWEFPRTDLPAKPYTFGRSEKNVRTGGWVKKSAPHYVRQIAAEEWIAERLRHAATLLNHAVEIDLDKRNGIPVVKGTRFTVAQLLAEVASGQNIKEISDDFDLDFNQVRQLIEGMAIYLDRPIYG